MSIKVLTKNGIDNSNIDGARAEYFNSGMRDGIVKGALNEGTFGSNSTNSVYLDTCELRIAGHRIIIDETVYQTFSSKPNTDKRYSFVAQVIVDDSSNVSFSIIIQNANTSLIKNNLYANQNGSGTYQVEIGRFTQLTDGTITDVVRTIDVITGNGNVDVDYIRIGNVTTIMLETGLDAEVDVENVINESTGLKETNFTFSIPKSAGSIVNVNGEQVNSVNFTSDPQTQIDGKANVDASNIQIGGNILNNNTVYSASQNRVYELAKFGKLGEDTTISFLLTGIGDYEKSEMGIWLITAGSRSGISIRVNSLMSYKGGTPELYYKQDNNNTTIYFKCATFNYPFTVMTLQKWQNASVNVLKVDNLPEDAIKVDIINSDIVHEKDIVDVEHVEVIYDKDSTDASINQGFTAGVTFGDSTNAIQGITGYKYYRVYVWTTNQAITVFMDGRKNTPFAGSYFADNNSTVLVGRIHPYNNNTLYPNDIRYLKGSTWTELNNNSNVYVYKVEGIK